MGVQKAEKNSKNIKCHPHDGSKDLIDGDE